MFDLPWLIYTIQSIGIGLKPIINFIHPIITFTLPVITFFWGTNHERKTRQYQEDRWYKQHVIEQKILAFHELALYLAELQTFLRMLPEVMYESNYPDWENRSFQVRIEYLKALSHCDIYINVDLKKELIRPVYIYEETIDIVISRMKGKIRADQLDKATEERRQAFDLVYLKTVALIDQHTEADQLIIKEILKLSD